MTSTQNPLHNLVLTPQQQSLLFAALNSNKPTNIQPDLSGLPAMYNGASAQGLDPMGFQHTPNFGYEYGLDGQHDPNFDLTFDTVDQSHMTDDRSNAASDSKSGSADGESPDKRSHPDDDDEENSEPKRREGEGKVAKKPGRKPLTTEPSSVSLPRSSDPVSPSKDRY